MKKFKISLVHSVKFTNFNAYQYANTVCNDINQEKGIMYESETVLEKIFKQENLNTF